MLAKRLLNIKIGDRFRRALEEGSSASGLTDPLPGLLWGKWDDETQEYYSIGFFERSEIPTEDPIRIVEADGIEFLITQDWICEDLEGKGLDIVDGQLSVIEQPA